MSEAVRKSSGEQDNEGDRDRSHAQASLYILATLVQELRNEEQREEQLMADSNGVVGGQASLDDFLSVVLLCRS